MIGEALWACPGWRDLTPAVPSGRHFSVPVLQDDSFRTEVTPGRIPDVMDHLVRMSSCVLNGVKAGAIQRCHYQRVAKMSRRARAHARAHKNCGEAEARRRSEVVPETVEWRRFVQMWVVFCSLFDHKS